MGQSDAALRLVVVDPDENFRAELHSLIHVGIEVVFVDPQALANTPMQWTNRDVAVVCVETPSALALVANIRKYVSAPPVVAIGGAGFQKKSLEHVLLLTEVRGAGATLPKPLSAPDLVLAARQAQRHSLARDLREEHKSPVMRAQSEAS